MKVINQDEIDGEEPILLIEYSSSDYDLPTPPKLDFDEWVKLHLLFTFYV